MTILSEAEKINSAKLEQIKRKTSSLKKRGKQSQRTMTVDDVDVLTHQHL